MKKTTFTFIVALIIIWALPTSAQKQINSIYGYATMFINADFVPHQFEKLLLITESIDRDVNKKLKDQFKKAGIEAITSLEVLPPIKDYSESDIMEICKANNVDAIAKVVLTGTERSRAKGLVAIKIESQTIFSLELTLFDIQSDMNVVKFVGTSASTKKDKAIYDYFRAVMG